MIHALIARDALMQSIRAFFHAENFVEVETPVRVATPCMELHIDAEPAGDHYLRTSPELAHKKLLSRGAERIFEIGKCFRQGERGDLHHPEYTMLEWYRTGGDYMQALEDTQRLFDELVSRGLCGGDNQLVNNWAVYNVADVFEEFAGWNPVENFDAERFDLDLMDKVEPALPTDRLVVLKDYPAELCALSRLKPGNPLIAERWELYLAGVEIANAYSELTDPVEQRTRFETWGAQRKAMGKTVYPLDEAFIEGLKDMPEACGVALGVDRLLMILCGETTLDFVLPFRR